MSSPTASAQRVHVEKVTYHFVVFVDTEAVLRCTARRDAMRYAVLVRQALVRAEKLQGNGSSSRCSFPPRQNHN